jgi:hypothetical protein
LFKPCNIGSHVGTWLFSHDYFTLYRATEPRPKTPSCPKIEEPHGITTDYNQIMASLMGKMMTKHDKTGGFGSTQFSDTNWDGLNQHFQLLLHAPANTWMCKNGHIPSSPKKMLKTS